jgi:hypothetical protein
VAVLTSLSLLRQNLDLFLSGTIGSGGDRLVLAFASVVTDFTTSVTAAGLGAFLGDVTKNKDQALTHAIN